MRPVPVRSLDETRYGETFAVIVRRSTEYDPMLARLAALAEDCPAEFRCGLFWPQPTAMIRVRTRTGRDRVGRGGSRL